MELGLEGKVALVTGGSRGIGKGIARGLAREGCDVSICSRDEEVLAAAAAEIAAETGRDIAPFKADASRRSPRSRAANIDAFMGAGSLSRTASVRAS